MVIDMCEIAGASVLAGAVSGRRGFAKLVELAPMPPCPSLIYLDFRQIEVATASYLRESVLAYRALVRGQRSTAYPIITNANVEVRDEFYELVQARGDALPVCNLDGEAKRTSCEIIGELDPKQRLTYDLVTERGETDAGELWRSNSAAEGLASPTAWNNRLSSLASLGLLIEHSQGRAKRYRSIFTEC